MTDGVIAAFAIEWDPAIRGILSVAVAVAILCGSVYLIVATNAGSRLGFLIAVAGLSGWMAIQGLLWWVYGQGYVGPSPEWDIVELVISEDPGDLSAAQLEEARRLDEWDRIPPGDPTRGEAVATASAALTADESRVARFDSEGDFLVLDDGAYEKGGKDPDSLLSELPGPHPEHFAIVQVRQAKEQVVFNEDQECREGPETVCIPFGETPPALEPVRGAPVLSVVMVRDLGSRRLPPALVTVGSLVIFGVACNAMHRRDKAAWAARERAEQTAS